MYSQQHTIFFEPSKWKVYMPKAKVPQQSMCKIEVCLTQISFLDSRSLFFTKFPYLVDNGFDCGVFMCLFVKAIAFNISLTYIKQEQIVYHRKAILLQLLSKEFIHADVTSVCHHLHEYSHSQRIFCYFFSYKIVIGRVWTVQ